MSKKRRTRAQKIRAQARRQPLPAEPAKTISQAIIAEPLVSKAANPAKPAAGAAAMRRPSGLRPSLAIFGVLIAAQLLLWLVFSLTNLDSQLYNLVEL